MATEQPLDVAVVGAGMLGTSAAKYLAAAGASVILIGQAEPLDTSTHSGVFGSHYDTARIVRIVDRDPFYATIAARSIRRFAQLEAKTETRFFNPVGHLTVSPVDDYVANLRLRGNEHNADVEDLDDEGLKTRFSEMRFASGMAAVVESGTGGYIDPRAFIRAQRIATEISGGHAVDGLVAGIDSRTSGVVVQLEGGREIKARRCLIATGAFANHYGLVGRRVDISVSEHTVVFGQLSDTDAAKLRAMPSLIYKRGDGLGESVYLTPPVQHADGRHWIKIGQSTGRVMPNPVDNLGPWFRSNGDPEVARWLRQELTELLADASLRSTYSGSCVVSQSPTMRPYVAEVPTTGRGEARIFTLLAGNGQVAKSADELGRIAAVKLLEGAVPDEYRSEDFTARFVGS